MAVAMLLISRWAGVLANNSHVCANYSRRSPLQRMPTILGGDRQTGSYSEMGSEKFSNPAKSGYNKGTRRSDIWYLVVSKDVRRHRLISISYNSLGRCHGRGREFESRRPRHSF
jgi:hypothetical protein